MRKSRFTEAQDDPRTRGWDNRSIASRLIRGDRHAIGGKLDRLTCNGDVIDQLKIGRTAFYRYFPTDRIKQLRAEHSDTTQT